MPWWRIPKSGENLIYLSELVDILLAEFDFTRGIRNATLDLPKIETCLQRKAIQQTMGKKQNVIRAKPMLLTAETKADHQ